MNWYDVSNNGGRKWWWHRSLIKFQFTEISFIVEHPKPKVLKYQRELRESVDTCLLAFDSKESDLKIPTKYSFSLAFWTATNRDFPFCLKYQRNLHRKTYSTILLSKNLICWGFYCIISNCMFLHSIHVVEYRHFTIESRDVGALPMKSTSVFPSPLDSIPNF